MLYLPQQADIIIPTYEKLYTYSILAKLGCPVFKSVVFAQDEPITATTIAELQKYFQSETVTIRYQYTKPSSTPVQGGNRYKLSVSALSAQQIPNTFLWVLEPIDRLKNSFGINIHVDDGHCHIEVVGRGFDVSDLNRSHSSPHQTITFDLPLNRGYYNEWWKYTHFNFISNTKFEESKIARLELLCQLGYSPTPDIFDETYKPLSLDQLEELLFFIDKIYLGLNLKTYCVSCSISDSRFVFWDIQTPTGKKNIYGVI